MKEQLEGFRSRGCDVVVVTPSKPDDLREVLAPHPQPITFVGDPNREVYRAFGLTRGKTLMFLSPKVIGHYLYRMLTGWRVRKPRKGEDLLQLGGDFILDSAHRLVYSYCSADPADRPSVPLLLEEVARTNDKRIAG